MGDIVIYDLKHKYPFTQMDMIDRMSNMCLASQRRMRVDVGSLALACPGSRACCDEKPARSILRLIA